MSETLSRRDHLAALATEEDLRYYLPKTIGDIRDEMIKFGVIPKARAYNQNPYGFTDYYTREEYMQLRALARYRHADAMIAASAYTIPDPLIKPLTDAEVSRYRNRRVY